MAIERRLAAILVADVVGFSRLMGRDEEGTLAALTAHLRDLFEPRITAHRGRVVKTTGDGLLVEFPSIVEAVRCALAVQDGMRERTHHVPESRRIRFRIGIDFGDVIIQDDDVYGDVVNIAARLETLSDAGGIVVSAKVRDEVHHKLELEFEDLGPQKVKNIAEPVNALRVRASQRSADPPADLSPPADKPSIAVLPFTNKSDDPGQEYFADGIREDIITGLSRFRWSFVIDHNSSFAYKGRAVDVKQVARELGVKYVLEGSVRKLGDQLRVTAQLVESVSGHQVWSERYDRGLKDVFGSFEF